MTAYQQFIKNPIIEPGKIARLWELKVKVNKNIENLTDFCRDFLSQVGFMYTGYMKDENGVCKAAFNNKFIWDGAIQDGEMLVLRIKQL